VELFDNYATPEDDCKYEFKLLLLVVGEEHQQRQNLHMDCIANTNY